MKLTSHCVVPWMLGLILTLSGCDWEPSGARTPAGKIATYAEARKIFWSQLYDQNGETLYCRIPFQGRTDGLNIEHVFPMSWVTKALECGKRKQCRETSALFNRIEADLHNLYPSDSRVNYERGSLRFGEVRGEPRQFGERCDFEVDKRNRQVEVTPASQGNVARAMFYMAWQYRDHGLRIFDRQARLLAQWHREDPVDDDERKRNRTILALQGNSNPFIDGSLEVNGAGFVVQ